MSPVLQAALASWSVPWLPTIAIILTALTYLRGWYLLRCAGFPLIPAWRVWTLLAGLFALWVALAGPMDVVNSWLLTAHMVQHMVLMMIAPPLILLGAPLIPLVRGLPIFAAREFAGPFFHWRVAQRVGRALTQPAFALLLMGVVMLGWHIPALYELAVRSSGWHQFEHACFFVTSLIFWWPVIQPWPYHSQWPRWAMVPYLVVADLQNTVLSAALVFADRVLYPSYSDVPRVFGLSAREDQAAAGAIMWVVGSVAFLVPAMLIAVQCLTRHPASPNTQRLKKCRPLFAGVWQRTMTGLGSDSSRAEMISFIALFFAVGLVFSTAFALSGSDDDELALRLKQQVGTLLVSVYASGGELNVGANQISVLTQDSAGAPVLDAQIEVSGTSAGANAQATEAKGAYADSENKLLQAASINLPAAGDWLLRINVQHDAEGALLSFPVQVVVHRAGLDDEWPYAIFPAFSLMLLLIYLRRAHHRQPVTCEHVDEAAASR